ncbi:hypothetical protein Tco_1516754 [Tanacetum coccineum]
MGHYRCTTVRLSDTLLTYTLYLIIQGDSRPHFLLVLRHGMSLLVYMMAVAEPVFFRFYTMSILNTVVELIKASTVMAISVSTDSSEDSVGIPARRVILFGTIPTTIPDTIPVITPPITLTDTTEIPIIAPNIPPSPDYTPASPDYSPASET